MTTTHEPAHHEPAHHEPPHHEPDYAVATDSLAARFAGVFTRDEVAAAVAEARAHVEPQSRIHDFLELLVERRAREILRARAAALPDPGAPRAGDRLP